MSAHAGQRIRILAGASIALAWACVCIGPTPVEGSSRLWWAKDKDTRQSAFLRSQDLDITRCSLAGRVQSEPVDLHLWVRALAIQAGKDNSTTLLVKGFGILQSRTTMGVPVKKGSPQMQQAKVHQDLGDMYLRSPRSETRHPLNVTVRGRPLAKPLERHAALSWVIELWGVLPGEVASQDLEMRVDRFSWFCNVGPATSAAGLQVAGRSKSNGPLDTTRGSDSTSPINSITPPSPPHVSSMPGVPGADLGTVNLGMSWKKLSRRQRQLRRTWRAQQERIQRGSHLNTRLETPQPSVDGDGMHNEGRRLSQDNGVPHARGSTHVPGALHKERGSGSVQPASTQLLNQAHAGSRQLLASDSLSDWLAWWGQFPFPGSDTLPPKYSSKSSKQSSSTTSTTEDAVGHYHATAWKDGERVDMEVATPRSVSGPGDSTQVCVVLSAFYRLPVDEYALLLHHHSRWHGQLGVNRYIQYVTEGMADLINDPTVQALVSEGTLTLVQYNEMPRHEQALFQPSHVDDYLMQVLIYNHALLALWGTDTLMMTLDLDEYLVTPKPMTAVQVFQQCTLDLAETDAVAGIQIPRRDAACPTTSTTNTGVVACDDEGTYKHLWINMSGDAGDAGGVRSLSGSDLPHPLTHLSMMSDISLLRPTQDTKALVDPNRVLSVHVHMLSALPGHVHALGDGECARVVHLRDLFISRPRPVPSKPLSASAVKPWWWPGAL